MLLIKSTPFETFFFIWQQIVLFSNRSATCHYVWSEAAVYSFCILFFITLKVICCGLLPLFCIRLGGFMFGLAGMDLLARDHHCCISETSLKWSVVNITFVLHLINITNCDKGNKYKSWIKTLDLYPRKMKDHKLKSYRRPHLALSIHRLSWQQLEEAFLKCEKCTYGECIFWTLY